MGMPVFVSPVASLAGSSFAVLCG